MKEKNLDNETPAAQDKSAPSGLHQQNMKTQIMTVIMTLSFCAALHASEPTPTPPPDKLHEAMAEFVTQITKTLADTKTFTAQQAPEVLSQYMAWQSYSLHVWIWALSIAAVILLGISILMWLEPDETGGVALCANALMFIVILFAIGNYLDIQKIKIAPKVYAIEYAKSLIK